MIRVLILLRLTFIFCTIGHNADCQNIDLNKAVNDLTRAEQDFAKEAVDHTIKSAFMNVLLEESIVFRPHPVNGKWAYRVDTRPDSAYLFWNPELVSISQGGDFGYSTGPWYAKRSKYSGAVKGFGNFVTIWKRDDSGKWRVVLDKGVNYSQIGERQTTLVTRLNRANLTFKKVPIDSLLLIDSKAFGGEEVPLLHSDVLLMRHFKWPTGFNDYFKSEVEQYATWEPLNGEVAPYGDMAYSYGKYQAIREGKEVEGYYLRIWTLQENKDWTIALDLRTDN